ncbi:hypothetical protein RHSIM_Rhsim07G0059800 [Rhododendron simsii]|uniref:Rx N-terminal domain-containing protein n=1 Tax=Rhododendron simsii TaxID=118357 RepID=A0A834LIF9_RHOSS|nr:hypothetical protein RHSIM_Rhsim07G0059800 [Rhododendron simsii]
MAGLALLGASFGVLLDRLSSPELIKFFRGQKHDERLLKKLRLKLLGLNKVLNDAEDKQITDRAVKEWMDELKDVVYHAEDLVDEIATAALRCKVEAEYQSGSNQVQYSLISSFTKLFDNEIESKLERMIDMLEDFTKEKDLLGLKEIVGQNWSHRSFIQRSNANNSLFVMHDLFHDLAQYMMGDFCYRLEDGKPHDIAEKIRHFSYVPRRFVGFEMFEKIREAKCLRTFLPLKHRYYSKWLSKKVVDEILPRLTRLRLLSLSEYGIRELPYSIGNLIHLRFLDLSRAKIRELPESVCTLYNLETLLLFKCDLLTTLPADLVKLISLRHLDVSGTNLKEMPMNISRLKDLRQLTVFAVGKCTGINELGEFHCLRGTISISGLQNVKSGNDAMKAKMSEKKHLDKLVLEWYGTTEDSQNTRCVLEKLEPHTNLKHLEIKNYGGTKFPTWLGDQSFCNMASLRLENCNNCFSLPALGQLSSLKDLSIERMPGIMSVDREFYGESGSLSKPFQSLETLRFVEMSGLVDWCILDAGEFSQLQKLKVINCPKLIGHLPTNLPSLVRLKIVDCPELVASLPNSTSIRKLELRECQGMQLQWQGVSSVEDLRISGFASLEEFPSELVTLTNPKSLSVDKCPRLYVPLSDEMSNCDMLLERLELYRCENLKSIPLDLFPKLRSLEIWGCKNMLSFPVGGLPALNLSYLGVCGSKKLKTLPEQMHTLLPSLKSLSLISCPEIESFPERGLPSKLDYLHIINCKKLVGGRRDWGLQALPSLTWLSLRGESEDVLESFPEEGLLPPTLTHLGIEDLRNLKSLNEKGLQLLGSLKRMEIRNCPQLQSLSVERLPTSLSELEIRGCPLLKPRCHREEGEDWHKIAHIPLVTIDEKEVPKSLAFENFQLQAGHAYGAGLSSFGTIEAPQHYYQTEIEFSILKLYDSNDCLPEILMNFATPPVTPQTTVKPLVPGTPPVLRNVEQYPQPTLGFQLFLYGTGNPIYQTGPRVGGSLGSIPSHLGDLCQLIVQESKDLAWVQHSLQPYSASTSSTSHNSCLTPTLQYRQSILQMYLKIKEKYPQQRPVIMALTRLFNETSEALGGSHANPAKKREIEDNSRKIGALFAKINGGNISKFASEKLVQLCLSLDNGDFGTACQIQVQLTTSDWDDQDSAKCEMNWNGYNRLMVPISWCFKSSQQMEVLRTSVVFAVLFTLIFCTSV